MMPAVALQAIIDELLVSLGASRVTLRQETPGEVFPVTEEACAPGAASIRGVETPNMSGQPVVLRMLAGEQVVQEDCEQEYPDDQPFQDMLELYGGMRAQIVTPVVLDGRTVAVISVHQLGSTRSWQIAEIAACSDAAARVFGELSA
jgi:GAF domain-containing protein